MVTSFNVTICRSSQSAAFEGTWLGTRQRDYEAVAILLTYLDNVRGIPS